jgi:hypothetical protein
MGIYGRPRNRVKDCRAARSVSGALRGCDCEVNDETTHKLIHDSWQNALALIKLLRSGDRQAAMELTGHLESMEMEYLCGSLAAIANTAFSLAADHAKAHTGHDVDIDRYLGGMIGGIALMGDDGQVHD